MSVQTERNPTQGKDRAAVGMAAVTKVARSRALGRVLIEAALGIVLLSVAVPILWLLVLSVQSPRSIVNPDFSLSFTLDNFGYLFAPNQPFFAQFTNSLLIVAGTVVFCVTTGTLAGYPLSHLSLPSWLTRSLLGLAGFLTLAPPMVLVPGLYVVLSEFHIIGGLGALILLNTAFQLPFSVLIMRIYFDRLPRALREAALVDGASESRIFRTVMLPLVRPGIAAVAVYVGIMAWDEFLFGLTMTTGGTSAPLTVGIASLVNPDQVVWGQLAGAGAVAAVPMIILAWIANSQLVAGLTQGSTKG